MKTKLLYLITIICIIRICIMNLYSQDITVNLSIIFIESPCVYKSDSLVSYPMLKITYTNNSQNDYYFRQFTHDKNGLNYQGCYELYQNGVTDTTWNYAEYLEKMESKRLFEHQNYIVNIELPHLDYGYWFIVDESYDKSQEIMVPDVNCIISNINYCINKYVFKNSDNDSLNKTFFTLSKVNKRDIKGNMHDQFMFLKACESKEVLYNLTSYYMVKGKYTFLTKDDHFKNHVINNIDCDGITTTIPLPEKVGEYKLYSGEFTSNSVTITFE